MNIKVFTKNWRYFGAHSMLRHFKFKIICFFKYGTFSTCKASKKILQKQVYQFKKLLGTMITTNKDFCIAIDGLKTALNEN